jgi:hypothetical protein
MAQWSKKKNSILSLDDFLHPSCVLAALMAWSVDERIPIEVLWKP